MPNADAAYGFRPDMILYGGSGAIPVWEGQIKSNHVFTLGDAVYASAGYLRNAATGDKAVVGVCAANKAESASGIVGTRVSNTVATRPKLLFYPAIDGIVFAGQCSGTPTQATLWKLVDIEGAAANSTGRSNQEVNEDATTNKNVYLIGFRGNTSIGVNSEVLFTWAKSKFSARGAMVLSTQYIGY